MAFFNRLFLNRMHTVKKLINFRWRISALGFIVLLVSISFLAHNAINLDKLAKWFYVGETFDLIGFVAFFILGLGLAMLVSALVSILLYHSYLVKFFAIVFVIFNASATYFVSKYNVAIDKHMLLNALHTDGTEVAQLLTIQMLPYLFFLAVLPILLIVKTDIYFSKPLKHLTQYVLFTILSFAIFVVALYSQFKSIHRAGNMSDKYMIYSLIPINYMNGVIGLALDKLEPYFSSVDDAEIKITGRVTKTENLVVALVIGETSRRKNFSIYGYERKNTTPILSTIDGLHLLDGKARLGSTILALPEILEKNNLKLPVITDKLGIETVCLMNYSLYDNCGTVEQIMVNDCKYGTCYDEDVLPLLEQNLKTYQSGYRFIVLHIGGGSHGPLYHKRHPKSFQKFKPFCQDADVINQCTDEELFNAYDNTIVYVDYVLSEIIKRLDGKKLPYVMMYLSDHGESLKEDGWIFHGVPPHMDLPKEQAEIPLIVKSSVPISIVKKDEYPQQDIFDTVLDLFSVESNLFDKKDSFIKKQTVQ